jgi:hypothetical protein
MDRIKFLEVQLEKESIQKKKELINAKESMRSEPDAIHMKAKLSFKSLVKGKNMAIDKVLGRARAADVAWRRHRQTRRTSSSVGSKVKGCTQGVNIRYHRQELKEWRFLMSTSYTCFG